MRGSIRKRGKRWTVVVPLGRDPETKKLRQQWKSFVTKSEAEAHLAHVLSQIHAGGYTPPSKVTTAAFLADWLEKYAAGSVAPTTLVGYRDIAHAVTERLGYIPLARLTPVAIQGYYTEKLASGLSPTTVHAHHRLLREALGHAERWGLIPRNPAKLTNPPRPRHVERRVWDEEQVRLFLAKAKRESPYYALYLTALLTGMRQGELLGLRWEDVDLALGQAAIRQTFYRLCGSTREGRKGQQLWKAPKTRQSQRTIALPPAVVAALRDLRTVQDEHRGVLGADYHEHGLVFCQVDGKPLHPGNVVRRDFRPLVAAAKLPRIRFHDLRHAHVSYLALAGVPVKVAQERVGHSSAAMTLDVYSHVLPGQQADAARKVEILLLGTSPQGSGDLRREP